MRTLSLDLRYAARSLRHSPGLVLVAVLSLGLGIGVNTTLYSAIKALLFAEASAADPDRLVLISIGGSTSTSYANLQELRARGILADAAGSQLAFFNARSGDEARRSMGKVVTAHYFDVLGLRPAIGRTFSSGEAEPARNPRVAVLSHGYWQRNFGGDPAALGRDVMINGQPFTIVGVLPQSFQSIEGAGLAPEIYVPLGPAVVEDFHSYRLSVLGRLQDSRNRAQTQGALAALAKDLEREHPTENPGFARAGAQLFGVSAVERLRAYNAAGPVMVATGLVAALFATVLVIACANVAGLLLARGAARRHEIAVRVALGASRRQIVQQLLAESFLLALLGMGCGWLLNLWALDLIGNFTLPVSVPVTFEFHINAGLDVLPFELLLAAVTMVLCGLAPAIESSRVALVPALKGEPPRLIPRPLTRRNLRVIGQVAGSTVLLAVASLFLRGLGRTVHLNPGFDADRVLTAEASLDSVRFNREQGLKYVDDAIRRIGALPGVEAASAASVAIPARFLYLSTTVDAAGQPGANAPQVKYNAVTPDYFRTLGIAILMGRDFLPTDNPASERVAIVNQAFAKRLFRDGYAVGRHVWTGEKQALQIVGLVRDSAYSSVGEAPQPVLYRPLAQEYGLGTIFQVRTTGAPSGLAAAVKRELALGGRDIPVRVTPMRDLVNQSLLANRAIAVMTAVTGGIGMLLALIGLYGLMSHSVSRRTSEIGVRMALGASPEEVLRGVMKDGIKLVGWGVAAGVVFTLLLVQPAVSVFLGDGAAADPLGVLAPALLLFAAGLAASYVPARHATEVEPIAALRCE